MFLNFTEIVITQKTQFQPHGGTRDEVQDSPKQVGFILWVLWTSAPNFTATYSVVVELLLIKVVDVVVAIPPATSFM